MVSEPQVYTPMAPPPAPAPIHVYEPGDASAINSAAPRRAELLEAFEIAQDRVRWGPIAAGFLTTLTTTIVLGVLGIALGLSVIDPRSTATTGTVLDTAVPLAAVWSAVAGAIAFWLGGFVAGRAAAVFSRGWGMVNGMMVFFLTVPFLLWLASTGLGGLGGGLVTGLNQISPADAAQAADAIRTGAWSTLLGLALAWVAAALGGAVGARRRRDVI